MNGALTVAPCIVYGQCMRTITIDDEAYKILSKLKEGKSDSFTRVIKRHLQKFDTCGEIFEWVQSQPTPKIDRQQLRGFERTRGKRSKRTF